MYYELIKMLIEYERNKQPEVTSNKPVFNNHFGFFKLFTEAIRCPMSGTKTLFAQQ